jgi:thiaminase
MACSNELLDEAEPLWETQKDHSFVHELADGALDEEVSRLRDELDRYGPKLSPRRQCRAERLFTRTVELEVAFFDAAYER